MGAVFTMMVVTEGGGLATAGLVEVEEDLVGLAVAAEDLVDLAAVNLAAGVPDAIGKNQAMGRELKEGRRILCGQC
jgi:hypothetical protein